MVLAVTWFQAAKGVAMIVAALATIGYLLDRWAKNAPGKQPAIDRKTPPQPVVPLPEPPAKVDNGTPSPEEVFPHLTRKGNQPSRHRVRR